LDFEDICPALSPAFQQHDLTWWRSRRDEETGSTEHLHPSVPRNTWVEAWNESSFDRRTSTTSIPNPDSVRPSRWNVDRWAEIVQGQFQSESWNWCLRTTTSVTALDSQRGFQHHHHHSHAVCLINCVDEINWILFVSLPPVKPYWCDFHLQSFSIMVFIFLIRI